MWFFLIKAMAGAIIGNATATWFKDTKMGIWSYGKLDQFLDYLVTKYKWNWLKQPEDAWRKKYPFVTKKIDELETRIKKLENGNG